MMMMTFMILVTIFDVTFSVSISILCLIMRLVFEISIINTFECLLNVSTIICILSGMESWTKANYSKPRRTQCHQESGKVMQCTDIVLYSMILYCIPMLICLEKLLSHHHHRLKFTPWHLHQGWSHFNQNGIIIILVAIIITFVLIIVIAITIVAIVFITTSLAICNRQSARGEEDKLLPWVSHLPKVELCN